LLSMPNKLKKLPADYLTLEVSLLRLKFKLAEEAKVT